MSKQARARHAAENSSKAKYRRLKPEAVVERAEQSEPILLTGSTCWCGKRYPHDWPGRSAGAAHPRA